MLENLNPLNWGKEKEVPPPGASIEKEGQALNTSVPMFHFNPDEIARFKAAGMTEEEIEGKRAEIINKIARARLGKRTN